MKLYGLPYMHSLSFQIETFTAIIKKNKIIKLVQPHIVSKLTGLILEINDFPNKLERRQWLQMQALKL